jgi:hypothetical protein
MPRTRTAALQRRGEAFASAPGLQRVLHPEGRRSRRTVAVVRSPASWTAGRRSAEVAAPVGTRFARRRRTPHFGRMEVNMLDVAVRTNGPQPQAALARRPLEPMRCVGDSYVVSQGALREMPCRRMLSSLDLLRALIALPVAPIDGGRCARILRRRARRALRIGSKGERDPLLAGLDVAFAVTPCRSRRRCSCRPTLAVPRR